MEYIDRRTAPRKKRSSALTVVLVILAVLLAATGVVSWLVLSDPYAGMGLERVEPSDALAQTFAKSAVTRKECSFSTGEVNSFLAYLYKKYDMGKEKRNIRLRAVAVAGSSGDSADVYLPVAYRGKNFGVSLNVTPSLDASSGNLSFRVNSAHIGRLPVPVDWVLAKAESRLPNGLSRSGNTVSCAAPSLKASLLNVSASVSLGKFKLENGTLKLFANTKVTVG